MKLIFNDSIWSSKLIASDYYDIVIQSHMEYTVCTFMSIPKLLQCKLNINNLRYILSNQINTF